MKRVASNRQPTYIEASLSIGNTFPLRNGYPLQRLSLVQGMNPGRVFLGSDIGDLVHTRVLRAY